MHDDIDRRTSSRARSRAQLFTQRCNYDAKLRRFLDCTIDFSDFGKASKQPINTGVLTPNGGS